MEKIELCLMDKDKNISTGGNSMTQVSIMATVKFVLEELCKKR